MNITKMVKFQLEMSQDEADKLCVALGQLIEVTEHLDDARRSRLATMSVIDRALAFKQLLMQDLEDE
jgi:hypothetical protein